MDKVKKEMIKLYQPLSNLDWLNYKITRLDDLTYHHIIKKSYGGKKTIENGALLIPLAHQYLHLIECVDIDTYVAINKMFGIINKQREEPTKEQREIIEYMLREFERVHKWDKKNNGKLLLQRKYLERDFNRSK